ncbi:MAG TPA: hypothetical protein PLN95_01120 [Candidatus Saccharibacteria bacterium]|nr:hypothetical protein [Candidatus Saccharibacteria bacterium]
MNKRQTRKVVRTFRRAMSTPVERETAVKVMSIRMMFTAVLFLLFGGLAGVSLLASPASAASSSVSSSDEEPPSCDDVEVGTGTGECADVVSSESHSKSSSSSRATSVNGVKLSSKVTVLARIRANGTPKSQQDNCFQTNRPMSLWTSYNAEGTTGWHWKSYPKGKRFCRINGAVRDPICHNQVKIGVPKSKPPKNAIRGKVKFVKKLKWHVEAVAKADEKVTTHAKAWCNSNSGYAYGEGRGMAAAYAVGRGSARGSVLVKLFAQAEAQATGDLALQLDGKSVIQVKAKVRADAFAKASSEAHALAECRDNPPEHDECPNIPGNQPPGYECNPPETPPTFMQFRQFNDLYKSLPDQPTTMEHCVTVDFPEGHSGEVFWDANRGSFANPRKAAQDGVQICSIYTAPSESGSDTITVTATDSTTELSVTKTSDPFAIKEWPAVP